MKTLTQFLESRNMYDLEYRISGTGVERVEVKSKEEAMNILKSKKDRIDYAYLFKPDAMNTSEPESLVFWYSKDDSRNYWNNTYKSNGLKKAVKDMLDRLRLEKID